MAHLTNDALLARYMELLADENSSDASLGVVILELEARGL